MSVSRERTFLQIAGNIPSLSEASENFVPSDGSNVLLRSFQSNLAPLKDCNVAVVWDYGGPAEQVVAVQEIDSPVVLGVGDGVLEVALVLINDDLATDVLLSGSCLVEELTDV